MDACHGLRLLEAEATVLAAAIIVIVAVAVGMVLVPTTTCAEITFMASTISSTTITFTMCSVPFVSEDLDFLSLYELVLVGPMYGTPYASAHLRGVSGLFAILGPASRWLALLRLCYQDGLGLGLVALLALVERARGTGAPGLGLVGARLVPCLGLSSLGTLFR